MAKVKFFSKEGQKPRSRSQGRKFGMDRKVLTQGSYMCNMKALSLLVKVIVKVKFTLDRRTDGRADRQTG